MTTQPKKIAATLVLTAFTLLLIGALVSIAGVALGIGIVFGAISVTALIVWAICTLVE